MKYITAGLFITILLAGIGLLDVYKKLSTANALAEALKSSNMKFEQKNKALKKQNKKLIAREKHIHKKITERRKKLTQAKLKRVKTKLLTAGPKMTPFLGMATIVGATSYDIKSYCNDIDEMEQFEYELFPSKDLARYDKTVCGVDYQLQLEQTANGVKQSYADVLVGFNKEQKNASLYWSNRYKEVARNLEKENTQFANYYQKKYQQIVHSLAEQDKQNNQTISFWSNLF